MAEDRLRRENSDMFSTASLEFTYPVKAILKQKSRKAERVAG
jgi:hypothetical protein